MALNANDVVFLVLRFKYKMYSSNNLYDCYRFALPKNINKTINKGSVLSSLNVFLMNKPQSISPQPKRSEKVIGSHRMKSYSMENVAMNTYLNENHKIANFITQK